MRHEQKCLCVVPWKAIDARSPEGAFIAGTPLERGEPVVGQLMMEYVGHIGVFTYYRLVIDIKILIKVTK